MEPFLIVLVIFATFFGIFYLHFSTRNRERLALIEKGAEASIFFSKERRTAPVWKILILNVALLLTGIGIGIFIASMLHYNLGLEEGVAYPGTIFLLAGIGLFTGFHLTKKLD
ncbi:MAG: hypothetical protein KDD04_01570 [Sinomicrobium sp.]|nr:hypothetical protein [Sinomicrobium sp.]